MQFHFHANQSHFHKNGFALRLGLKQRLKGTRKWPIIYITSCKIDFIYCGTIRPTGSPRKPLAQSRRQPNKASQRRSNNGKDMLRKRQGTLGSAVRRSQRLAGRRTPVGVSKMNALRDLDTVVCVCLRGDFFF